MSIPETPPPARWADPVELLGDHVPLDELATAAGGGGAGVLGAV